MNATQMLAALGEGLDPSIERIILCAFVGDPKKVAPTAWRPRPYAGEPLDFEERMNVFATVSSFGPAPDGTWRRRGALFTSGRALMIDDVGTKVDRKFMKGVRPTAIVETSAGNEQWWFVMRSPERDGPGWDALIRAFIHGPMEGIDPGMSGTTRVGRLPGYTNGKPKHKGFVARSIEEPADADKRFEMRELLDIWNLKLFGRREPLRTRIIMPYAEERIRAFTPVWNNLDRRGMIRGRKEPDAAGWCPIECPWEHEHSDGDPGGAGIRQPSIENDWNGAFRCHHGHCEGKGWKDLMAYLHERNSESLAATNSEEAFRE